MFRKADRPTFSNVQSGLFPIYFGLQTAIPVVLAVTFPGNAILGYGSGIKGLLADINRTTSLIPIATMFVTGLLNLFVLLPVVTQLIKDRKGQGKIEDSPPHPRTSSSLPNTSLTLCVAKRDGKEWHAEGPQSDEMRALNKKFGAMHGISSLVNLSAFIATVVYGFTLGGRLL